MENVPTCRERVHPEVRARLDALATHAFALNYKGITMAINYVPGPENDSPLVSFYVEDKRLIAEWNPTTGKAMTVRENGVPKPVAIKFTAKNANVVAGRVMQAARILALRQEPWRRGACSGQ